jgi:hypothetical protein
MNTKRINRNDKFCTSVRKKDVNCVLSNTNIIQCECAHIVPLNGDYGQNNYENPNLLNNSANGMLLSKELHLLYDMFIWCINPINYEIIKGIPIKHKYNIEIASNYKDTNISINTYNNITIRAESHYFIELAHSIFLHNWNLCDNSYLKLNIKQDSILHILHNNNHINNYTNNHKDNHKDNTNEFTTLDKLNNTYKNIFINELNKILLHNIENKTNFNKKNKLELSTKYNLHPESISSEYAKLKKEIKNNNPKIY